MKLDTYVIECARGYKMRTGDNEEWADGAYPTWHTIAERSLPEALDKAVLALQVANQIDDAYTVAYITKTSGVSHQWIIELAGPILQEARKVY